MTAKQLEEIWKESGLTQELFAQSIGVSKATFQRWIYTTKKVPENRIAGIRSIYPENNNDVLIPTYKKDGSESTIREVLTYIIDNEDELKKDKLFLRYINSIGKEAIIKYFEDNNLIKKKN